MLEMTQTDSCSEQGAWASTLGVYYRTYYPDTYSFYLLPGLSFLLPRPLGSTFCAHTSSTLEEWQEAPSQLRVIAPKSSHGGPSPSHG